MSHVDYSIVVPCFGSGEWLEELVQRTEAAMKSLGSFELILINDKSPDMNTWAEIERLAAEYRFVRGLDLLYNVGQFRAILCGIDRASGAFLITMDDDLQHPPEEIPKLIDAMHANPTMDCIIGKYITKRLYLGYRRVFGASDNENRNEALLEYRITARWLLMAVFGDAGIGGLDLVWSHRY